MVLAAGILIASTAITLPAAAASMSPTIRSGATWSVQPTPNPPGSVGSYLSSVSCVSAHMCMAVGTYYTTFDPPPGIDYTLAEQWDGSSWSVAATPTISGVDNAILSGVSCDSADSCTAVGYTVTKPDNPKVRALVESWNGTSWRVVATPVPNGATYVSLSDVWCHHTAQCVAVGGYLEKGNELPLTEAWNGSVWSVLNSPNPHAENGSSFTSIDCMARSTCEVVGDYDYADVAQSVIAYSYRGSTWKSQKQKNPSGQGESNSNNGLSCSAEDSCTAVGNWTNNAPLALSEFWNGTTLESSARARS
ncbi:MAG: hypothetical protein WAM97_15760 [Acidimicrobiales bacterium]